MLAYIVKNNKEAKLALLKLRKLGYENTNDLKGEISRESVYFTCGTEIRCYLLWEFKKCFPSCTPTTVTQNDESKKRNISVTLKQAREWYHGNNSTLKELALTVYTEKELGPTLDDIYSKVESSSIHLYIPSGEYNKFKVKAKLNMIAAYYNGDWKMEEGKTGYFLGKNLDGNTMIMKHSTIKREGITYFENREDAEKAMELLKDEIKYLI